MKTPVASWLLSFCCLTFCLSSLINLNGHFNAFFGVSVDLLDISLCVSEQLPLLSWTEKPVTLFCKDWAGRCNSKRKKTRHQTKSIRRIYQGKPCNEQKKNSRTADVVHPLWTTTLCDLSANDRPELTPAGCHGGEKWARAGPWGTFSRALHREATR